LIEDFREGSGPFQYEADLCIVGAGPAGLAIARAFAGSRHRVCLIESGGLRCEDETQQLLEGVSVGEPGLRPAHSRLRVYGGSCRLWGGGCIPLSPREFEAREWIPHSGWPIRYDELASYYERARDVCELRAAGFADGSFDTRGHRPLAFDPPELVSRAFALSPVEFGSRSLPALAKSANVRVLLHANLLELHPVPDAEHVREATIGALGGRRGTVRARFYVLAAGGIENARLLLLSDSVVPQGLGNRHDLVGRFFQDHPRCRLGVLTHGRLDRLMGAYGRSETSARSHLELCLSDDAQRAKRVLACRARPFAVHAPPSPGIQALRELRACIGRRFAQVHDDEGTRLEHAIADALDEGLPAPLPPLDPRQVHPARAALRAGWHAGDVAAGALRRLAGRSHLRRERVEVMGYFEQAPNPHSRIGLDQHRDALGLRRVRVDWRLTELDRATHRQAANVFGHRLARACGSQFQPDPWIDDPEGVPELHGTAHHLGTTRMADNPRQGVVDRDCRVHGIDNLYVAGSSVFPTGSWAFPTFTIVALSLRLADHLRSRLELLEPFLVI
jgi:choline dehydrogenase-like flavoprotein